MSGQFRFAFLVMAPDHDAAINNARMETPGCKTVVVGVNSMEDACARAQELISSGEVDRIELCGAFGEDGARRVAQALGGKIPVSYIVQYTK